MPIFAPKNLVACEVSSATLGSLLGISARRIQQLHTEGIIPRGKEGFKLLDGVRGYVKWRDDQRDKSATYPAERARLVSARAREVELKNAVSEHSLIDIAEALAAMDEVIGCYRMELGGLPARLSRDVDTRAQITAEIDAILDRVTNRFSQRALELKTGGTIVVQGDE
jgi:phage terminase Nu1 subunit (DNA packaging protein)